MCLEQAIKWLISQYKNEEKSTLECTKAHLKLKNFPGEAPPPQ